jgi:hypothetical protein
LAGWSPGATAESQSAQPAHCSYSGPPPHPPFTDFPTDRLDPKQAAPKAVADELDARLKELLTQFKASAGAAGGVGDTNDMLALVHAWVTGRLLSVPSRNLAASLLRMDVGPSAGYGRGVMVLDVPPPEPPTTWIGHNGAIPGCSTTAVYDVARRAYIAVVLTNEEDNQALANMMLKTLD